MPKSKVTKHKSLPYARHYNHNVDRIEILPETRWKDSEASGAEYRYGIRVNMYHKAKVIKTLYVNNSWFPELSVDGNKLQALLKEAQKPPDAEELTRREPLCNHFACTNTGALYLLRSPTTNLSYTVRYCAEHRNRGDCALVDNSDNLVPIPD